MLCGQLEDESQEQNIGKSDKKMNLCPENDLGSGNLKAEDLTGGQFTLQTLLSATQKEIRDTCWTVVS